MSDTPVYMLVNLHVTNADEYRIYEKGFFPILKKYCGQFITYDDQSETLEGTVREGRMIMFSFPSAQVARDWFADPEYQALSEHRRAGTEMQFLTMVHGLPPRS